MQSLKQKQNYLRDNIAEERYQQFYEYLMDKVGNFDIERWSKEFIVEIVQNYLLDHPIQNNEMETSFYIYQHNQNLSPSINSNENIKTIPQKMTKPVQTKTKLPQSKQKIIEQPHKVKTSENIKSVQESNHQINKKQNVQKKNLPVQEINNVQPDKKVSAVAFIDNFFSENQVSNGKNEANSGKNNIEKPLPSAKDFLTIVPTAPQKVSVDFSLFDNRQFWSSSSNKPTKAKQNINFDFVMQPNTARSHRQTSNFSTLQVKKSQSPLSLPETNHKHTNVFVPNFDDMMMNLNTANNKQKMPSPYLKKGYAQQKIISQNNSNNNNTSLIKLKKVQYNGVTILKSEFKDNVKCFQASFRSQLKQNDVLVIMQGHQIVNRSFLMPDYVMYSIRVMPMNIRIKRNYEDLTHLRKNLSEFYPGIQLPYLQKNSWFSSTNADNIKKQKMIIQQFLNHLISNEELRHSKLMQDFLMISEHKRIKRKFEQYEKLQKPKSIQQLCLLKGSVDVNISQNQRIYHQNLKDYYEKMVQYFQKHERLTFNLAKQYEQVNLTLNSLTQLCKQISSQTEKFNQKVYNYEIENIQKNFNQIEKCYKQESKYVNFQLEMINSRILPFINYQKLNLSQLEQFINLQESFLKTYIKRNQYEKIDSSIPYTSDKIKPYKLGVMNQSKHFTVMMYQAGYLSNQLCNESKRVFQGIGARFGSIWKRVEKRTCQELEQKLEFWKKTYSSNDNVLRP